MNKMSKVRIKLNDYKVIIFLNSFVQRATVNQMSLFGKFSSLIMSHRSLTTSHIKIN
jgi:hypothetical protein